MSNESKPLTLGQANKKLYWCTVSLRRSTLAQLKVLASRRGTSVADLLEQLLQEKANDS